LQANCRRVTVRDVLITNSPFWTLHFADCDGVVVSGVRIWCNLMVPNNDGVEVSNFDGVTIDGSKCVGSPQNPRAYPIALRDGKGARLLVGDTAVSQERVKGR
jgi:hypothetical protein